MLSFFRDLIRDPRTPRTVILVDEAGTAPPSQHRLDPRYVIAGFAGSTVVIAVLFTMVLVMTPLRTVILGPDPETLRETARTTAMRASALSDSLEMQRHYLDVIRASLTGITDTTATGVSLAGADPEDDAEGWLDMPALETSESWADHDPAGLPPQAFRISRALGGIGDFTEDFLVHLQFPALPPVEGFFARGYDITRGHFGVDIAVDEGTPVRAIGDGYVVFSDWTSNTGFMIAVQHAGGFLSIYKHNSRLLKRVGERVRSRETIASSGNTGEITSGPHLHFELWRNGLAQDPRQYLVGL